MDLKSIKLKEYANMEWLRSEVVVWHAVADQLIGNYLINSDNILEIATGNGFFTFMSLGGKFNEKFDHYYSVDLDKRKNDGDIYDSFPKIQINKFIKQYPLKKLEVALDHKQSTLDQVKLLNLSNNYICQDANTNFSLENIDTIYTNSIYWLKNPLIQLERWYGRLNNGAKIILVFPNSDFFNYCRSYKKESKMWKLLNRGRADTLMWSMDFIDFEKKINTMGYHVVDYKRYLSKLTLQIDDIGLRPISPQLIKMANSLKPDLRFEIKQEWVETMMIILTELLDNEIQNGPKEGGYNFVVLEK